MDPGRTLVIEGHDVATGLGVEPLQLAVMPPDVQVQHVAAALKGVASKPLDLDGLVHTGYETFPARRSP